MQFVLDKSIFCVSLSGMSLLKSSYKLRHDKEIRYE